MASPAKQSSKKLRILLFPFFATSHIGPYTDLAFHLVAARPGAVEATVAVTPANASVVLSALARRGPSSDGATVQVATYPFPVVDGLPPGVENLSAAAATDAWRIDAAAWNEDQMRPGQECLVRERSPDAIITDIHFSWNVDTAADLGVPCVTFHAIGTFPTLALVNLASSGGVHDATASTVTVPGFPSPDIRVPVTELPDFLRTRQTVPRSSGNRAASAQGRCLGLAVNTFFDLEHGYILRILRELALGLEASGKSFLWVIRADTWMPPEGWKERVGDRGMVVTGWAPQTLILAHPAFITERLITQVLAIGERLWPEGAGVRSTNAEEHELIPAEAVARAVAGFMEPGGAGDAARSRIKELSAKAHAAMEEGGSSYNDLRRLIDDIMKERRAGA
ncbi:unnamed protein product [Urochloa decumbens]|uniref:Uncharacterized protein n=1 Tax=Urochloa decumbens TaxID=240449 RepID=A0ABC8WFH1_9POAL